ncbi:Uncharacterized membrane protein [Arthrobacter alpinus]|uniref:Uncharacterized membrane protein n=1 Tax=Arthrobacter alpinus TaxID=656366 RepID=A0A1H5IVU1_9MICC|nr:anthrone oxygenase family protein [Arthrobacter alpinus]SEE44284.1 Uncharacterized membrane protein [Arthrobacter alpinus]
MTPTAIAAITTTSLVFTGLAGGVYLAFSAIVMPALRTLPSKHAIATMQRINVSAVRPPFMIVFFGGAAASAVLAIMELAPGTLNFPSVARISGAVLALTSFGITILRNVPLNNALAAMGSSAADSQETWKRFDGPWSTANFVRGIAAVAATGVLALSLA